MFRSPRHDRALLAVLVLTFCSWDTDAAEVPAVAGWKAAGDQQRFPSGELWKYINGAAELFESHGVRELAVGNLQRADTTVAVSVYEMSSPIGAFGVYGVESSADGTSLEAGAAAMLFAPYQALMHKDRFYVKVDVTEGGLDADGATSLLSGLAEGLPGSDDLPKELRSLPAEGRREGTLGFTAEGYLGLGELHRCVHAEYALDGGGEATLFLMLPAAGESVDELWSSLPEKWSPTGPGGRVKIREIPYRGPVAVRRSEIGLAGATGPSSRDALLSLLDRFP
jgi:hypothetical protein